MQITATLKLMVPEIVIPTEAEDSDHDEDLDRFYFLHHLFSFFCDTLLPPGWHCHCI